MENSISYARSFRATNFDEYIGNEDIKETLMRTLGHSRPQSILLMGSSGCGKTTMARIVAKIYNCEDPSPEKGACDECMSCQLFNEYIKTGNTEMLPDIYEIDASDTSGKKDIDLMLQTMEYPAMGGAWKVYIIDEAHLLSKEAMGRLLKSLEEPKEGVLIILCTTDPDDLLDTIRNRCQLQLKVTKPGTQDIMKLLKRVCLSEDKEYDMAGLRMLASISNNVVRDSLNNVERVINSRGDATAKSVSEEFKQVSDKYVFDFYEAYQKDDYVGYINVLYKIKTAFNFEQFVDVLTNFTIRGIYILNSVDVEGLTVEELELYKKLFLNFTSGELSKILSELKRMRLGDIEANLMAFIYCKQPVGVEEPVVSIPEDEKALQKEVKARNNNLEAIEKAKVERGTQSLTPELREVSLDTGLGDLFTLQKVT